MSDSHAGEAAREQQVKPFTLVDILPARAHAPPGIEWLPDVKQC
jgi:hypothetical protein